VSELLSSLTSRHSSRNGLLLPIIHQSRLTLALGTFNSAAAAKFARLQFAHGFISSQAWCCVSTFMTTVEITNPQQLQIIRGEEEKMKAAANVQEGEHHHHPHNHTNKLTPHHHQQQQQHRTDSSCDTTHISSSDASSFHSVVTPPGSVASMELQEFCFPSNLDLVSALEQHHHYHPSSPDQEFSVAELQSISREARPGLMELTMSRTGRELQRWAKVNNSETPNCRMTTGCVPIVRDGRILLVSSAKSPKTFIFPKGGWEEDESLPLSALRETLEEAGVTGLLGPPLETLTFETKKAAKRRQSKEGDLLDGGGNKDDCSSQDSITENSKVPTEKGSKRHTHNRMTLFPLYVQSVYDHWPEETRCRRIVTIEEATDLLHHRPEFAKALQMVAERNLHRLSMNDED